MLVDADRRTVGRSVWRSVFRASLLVAVVAVTSLVPYLFSSTDIVKLRNAMLLRHQRDVDFNWTPDAVPADFKLERGPADPFFVKIAELLDLAAMPDDWARARAISRHLLGSSVTLNGGAAKSDLRGTYTIIVADGGGYCADFVRTFMAIAFASGMHVRAWAFSFDGFGGHGHVWPEIWNRQLRRWQLLDVYNNYYFFEEPGVPLSAMEFRRAMLSGSKALRLGAIDPSSRAGWKIEEKAWDYYRRGLAEWYMWWGNNEFAYDRSPLVRLFAGISRSLEQLGGIAEGVSPKLQILVTPENQRQADHLGRVRLQLQIVTALVVIAFVGMAVASSRGLWLRRKDRGTY